MSASVFLIYWIPSPWPGRLGILPRPRGGDWLRDEIRSWRAAGLDVVASLLTPDEAAELDLREEADFLARWIPEQHPELLRAGRQSGQAPAGGWRRVSPGRGSGK